MRSLREHFGSQPLPTVGSHLLSAPRGSARWCHRSGLTAPLGRLTAFPQPLYILYHQHAKKSSKAFVKQALFFFLNLDLTKGRRRFY